ncbi:MAG: Cna B-type domain-containing protein, partial [Clostridiales bacterium]|nr:Cna B-type domain-containing protein [Clostridiales bacterium]
LKGGATPIEAVVSGNNTTDADWNHTFTNVAKYNDSGDEITYTLEEQEVSANDFKFYKKTISGDYKAGFNVANTFEVPDEKVEVQVNKVWEDDSNSNSKRPTSIKYVLKGGESDKTQVVTGSTSTNADWSYKFTNLPKYSATGDEIQYTVEEQEVNTDELKFYEKEITGTMNAGFNIKNKFKVPEDKISVNVVKTWEDNSNVNGKRPASIKYILKGGASDKEQVVSGNTTTNDNWSYTFANLPKYNAQGNEITYTVEEQEVNPGDLKFYNKQIAGFNVTNTFRIPDDKVKVEITKKWEDASNVSNKRPASVKIELSDGANVVRTQELTGTGNEWKHTFTYLPKYNSQGNTITYTLDEKEVNPGDLQFYTKSIVGNTITNTFTQSTDKINVNVSKTWNDSNNANRKRPVSIKYVLKNKETVVSEKVVAGNETTDADWTHTFTGLAKYDEHNDEIKYTLEEQEANEGELKFYTKQVNGDYKVGFNVVNTFKVPDERISVRVSKTWNDDSNSRGKRPASIKYVLSGNGSTVEQIVTGESNTDTNWSYEFSNLVKYEANTGNEISYTVREEEVNPGDLKFYEPTISGDYKAGINVTNKFVVPNDKVTPRVTITWEDNNNNGNKRPSNVKIIVKDKEGKVVKEGNVTGNPTDEEWNKIFENVPKYDKDGNPIPYTVEEKPNSPDDFKFYKITVTGDIDKGYKVTNKFEVPDEKITVKVKKVWEDSNNAASKRPTAIKVQLKNNAAIVREERVTGSGNEWTYTFENVSKYNGYGDVINYTVEEIEEQTEDLKFYEKKITGDKDSEYVITNKFKVPDEKIEINVNKTWEDNNNAANKRPQSIKYILKGGAAEVEQVVSGNRTTDANWSYEFTNVKKYDNNANEIVYSVEEQEVNANDLKFYTKKVSGEQTNGFAVVNKFTVPTEKVTVKVSKTWDDNNNAANKRPASIKYEVLNSNNQIVASKVQSGNKNTADGWSHNFELDKYDALGNEEVYNVQEVEVNQNDFKFYKATVSGNYKSGFTVTNKFEVPNEEVTPKITVEWKDNSNQNNKRPTSVKIQVKDEEGRIVKESPVTGLITEESWKKIFENVPKYNKNGDPINYTITEEPNNPNDLEFYTTTTSGNITNGFKVVNTYAVPGTTISLKANKKWLDGNNAKNKRPASIKIEVRNNNEVVADKEVKGNRTTDANWEVEFKNLPKYNPITGVENVYTVTETEVHQGELMYYTSAVNGNTITNTIKPVTEGKIEDSKVEKESTLTKITKADEIVPYTITYKGKIKEYMGDAVVKIVDELPFKLDLSKSNIMDGSYDDESKTITWTENLNNIDTHSNGDKEVEIKKEIKLVYKDLKISEENLKVTNKVRVEISLKELNKKITENNTKEIPAEISSKVTVKYVLKSNRSMKLKEDKVITGHVGDAYQTTIPNDIDQDAYEFVEVEGNENGKISQEEKVVTYLYKKKFGRVVVSYVEKSTGMKLQNDEVIKGNINEPYNAEGKEIEYYNLVSTEKSENAKPVITEDEQKITHYYAKKVFNIEIDKELKEATIDGEKRTFRNGKFTKLDIPVKKILNSEVKVRYSINVRNTGEIKGSTVIQENIPKYFTMNPSENPDWRIENGKIVSKEIELNPGESKELSITLKWTNSKDNFGTLVNKAGIEKTKNNAGFEETDTEEEKKGKKQQATLVLVPKTGLDINKLLQMTGVGITLTALVAAMGYTISRKVKDEYINQ